MNGRSKLLFRHDAATGPNKLSRPVCSRLNFFEPRAHIANLIAIELIDIGTAEFAASIETKFPRVELQDRATIGRVSRR
jgi:hypothetical protein